MPPLADQHGVAVVEIRHDESRVGVGEHGIDRFGAVGKPDHVLPQGKGTREACDRARDDLERPSVLRVAELGYLLTTAATAAAPAATCRGSGPKSKGDTSPPRLPACSTRPASSSMSRGRNCAAR